FHRSTRARRVRARNLPRESAPSSGPDASSRVIGQGSQHDERPSATPGRKAEVHKGAGSADALLLGAVAPVAMVARAACRDNAWQYSITIFLSSLRMRPLCPRHANSRSCGAAANSGGERRRGPEFSRSAASGPRSPEAPPKLAHGELPFPWAPPTDRVDQREPFMHLRVASRDADHGRIERFERLALRRPARVRPYERPMKGIALDEPLERSEIG